MRLVRTSLGPEDDGFCLGTVAVECSGAESEALVRLPDVYHPLLDVYEARAVPRIREKVDGKVVQLRVQLARCDAAALELLLRQRVLELIAPPDRDRGRGGEVCTGHAGV